MQFRIDIQNVQAINRLSFDLDLAQNRVICIVGRNGVGKTTLVRSIKTLSHSDTFLRTAPDGIVSYDSWISYKFDNETVTFDFDPHINSLNCKSSISQELRDLCVAELPIPHGDRFNFFQSVSQVDQQIRRQIVLEEYSRPSELIEFLTDIYSSDRFRELVETNIAGRSYYSVLLENGRYLREDYLSSGEYFLIRLYKTIKSTARLIVIDEIDISLDAVAQVKLLGKLREFCHYYNCNVLFTTHSLAMMRTLADSELLYMDRCNEETYLDPVSYSYVKSVLFAFSGWDRYILTEDWVLSGFLESVIRSCCKQVFFRYKIIYIGGASQVVNLLNRNREECFFSTHENVIAVLDGDQSQGKFSRNNNVHFVPFSNVENVLHEYYCEDDFPYRLPDDMKFNGHKDLFNRIRESCVMSIENIYEYIRYRKRRELEPLVSQLDQFLARD